MEQKTFVISILVIMMIVVAGFIYFDRTSATLSASGESVLEVEPDKVSVYFQIQAINESAEIAKNKIAEISNNVISALKLAGLEDIQTEQYSIYPNYEYPESQVKSYIATQQIKVSTKAYDLAGKIIDLGVNNKATVNYINFELSQEKEAGYKAEALEKASQDARNKAQATASGLNKKLGKIISVTSSDYNYYPYRFWDFAVASESAKEAATNIQPNKLQITANVQATFKIY